MRSEISWQEACQSGKLVEMSRDTKRCYECAVLRLRIAELEAEIQRRLPVTIVQTRNTDGSVTLTIDRPMVAEHLSTESGCGGRSTVR